MYECYGTGVFGPYYNAGAPVAGTNEVQTLTFAGTWLAGEKFRLVYAGFTTALISWSATNATLVANIQAALDALANLGSGWTVVATGSLSSGLGGATVTFSGGDVSVRDVAQMTVTGNTSALGTLVVSTTTPGVNATYRDAQKGALLVDTTNALAYQKTGATGTGTYTKVGVES